MLLVFNKHPIWRKKQFLILTIPGTKDITFKTYYISSFQILKLFIFTIFKMENTSAPLLNFSFYTSLPTPLPFRGRRQQNQQGRQGVRQQPRAATNPGVGDWAATQEVGSQSGVPRVAAQGLQVPPKGQRWPEVPPRGWQAQGTLLFCAQG